MTALSPDLTETWTRSAYAVRSPLDDGTAVWSSTRTGHHVLVGSDDDAALNAGDWADLDAATGETLVVAGILVPSGWAERDAAQDAYRSEQEASDELNLTISPTVACNLRCGYCFEADHPARAMSEAEQDQLVAFVRRSLPGRRALSVTWFGGEPTLQMRTITRLSRRLMQVASFAGASYSASIITNGTLIDDDAAAALRAARVSSAQITMDGTPEIHDLLRPTASGRGSYEATLRGIEATARHVSVNLRVNIDRRNAPRVPALLEELAARGLFVNLGFVRTEPPAVYHPELADSVEATFLTVADFAALEVELFEHARALGFTVGARLDTSSATPCAAVKSSHFAFEPGGRVKRCWADVADDNQSVGTLGALGVALNGEADQRWRSYEPFDTGCETCPFLPVCWGGCPKARLDGAMSATADPDERRRFKERYVCTPRKSNWSELVRRGFVI